ncbi:hypothetical protein KAI46_14930 [bacterium]|nr:hypothetical protein [bacterium]
MAHLRRSIVVPCGSNRLRSLGVNILDQYSVDYHVCIDVDISWGTCPAMEVHTTYGELIFYIPLNVEKELLSKDIVNKELGKNFRMNLKEQDEYIDIREKEGGFFGDSWFPNDMKRLIKQYRST